MNLTELYQQIPQERHEEISISGDRLFFDNEEYTVTADGELKLVHSQKQLEKRLALIEATLGIA